MSAISFNIRSNEGVEGTCGICMESFEEDEKTALVAYHTINQASHSYHRDCIKPWLDNHSTCPTCRAKVIPSSIWSTKEKVTHAFKEVLTIPIVLGLGTFAGALEASSQKVLFETISERTIICLSGLTTALARKALSSDQSERIFEEILILGVELGVKVLIASKVAESMREPIDGELFGSEIINATRLGFATALTSYAVTTIRTLGERTLRRYIREEN